MDRIERFVERRNPGPRELRRFPFAEIERFELVQRVAVDVSGPVAAAVHGRIVRDDQLFVAGHVHVELDRIDPGLNRFFE